MSSEKMDRKNPDQRTTKKREEALIRDIARRLEAGEESSRPLKEIRDELSRPRTVYVLVALTEEEANAYIAPVGTLAKDFIASTEKYYQAIRTALARPVEPWVGWECCDVEHVHYRAVDAEDCERNGRAHNRVLVFPCEEEK